MKENSENMPNSDKKEEAQPVQPSFSIQKVYVKDISLETPSSPQVFQKQWQPAVNMDLENSARLLDDNFYEVVLSITVTVSFENETVYLIEVQQAGVFQLMNIPDDILDRMLNTMCPNILFPFAREVISDLVSKGGFPQLLIAPVNFDALYAQKSENRITDS
jgi:preprotein translocase subunit SecB